MDRLAVKIISALLMLFLIVVILLSWQLIKPALRPSLSVERNENISIVKVNESQILHNLYIPELKVSEEMKTVSLLNYQGNINNVMKDPNFSHNLPLRVREKLEYDKLPKKILKKIVKIFDDMEKELKKEKILYVYRELERRFRGTLRFKDVKGEIAVFSYLDIYDYKTCKPSLCSRVYRYKAPETVLAVLCWDNIKNAQEKLKNNRSLSEQERKELENFNRLKPDIQRRIKKDGERFSMILEEEFEKYYKQELRNMKAQINVSFPYSIHHEFLANGERRQEYYPNNKSLDKRKEFFVVVRTDKFRKDRNLNGKAQYYIFVRDKRMDSLRYFELPFSPSLSGRNDIKFILDKFILLGGNYFKKSHVLNTENGDLKTIPEAFGVTGVFLSPAAERAIIRYNSEIQPNSNALYDNLVILDNSGDLQRIIKHRKSSRRAGSSTGILPLGWETDSKFYFRIKNQYWQIRFK